jgi:hypothetical protein
MPLGYGYLTRHLRTRRLTLGEAVQITNRRVVVLENEEKNTAPRRKYIHVQAPTATMNKRPAHKVPMQTELWFRPHSSSYGPRTDAATGRLSFASPLKGREPDIKAKEPGASPSAAPTASTGGSFLQLPPHQHRRRRPPLHQRRQLARRTGRSSLPSLPRK